MQSIVASYSAAGWWCWADIVIRQNLGLLGASSIPFVYWIPGIVATLAWIIINMVRREDLGSARDSFTEDSSEVYTVFFETNKQVCQSEHPLVIVSRCFWYYR